MKKPRPLELFLFGAILATIYVQWTIILVLGITRPSVILAVVGAGGLVVNTFCVFLAVRLVRLWRAT